MQLAHANKPLAVLASSVIILYGMHAAASVLIPILLTLFLAVLLTPIEFRLNRWIGVPRPVAATLTMFVALAVVSVFGLAANTSLAAVRHRLPHYEVRFGVLQADGLEWLHTHGVHISAADVANALDPGAVAGLVGRAAGSLGLLASNLFLVLLLLAFILYDAFSIRDKILRLVERISGHEGRLTVARTASDMQKYLGVKTGTSLATGLLVGLMVGSIGVDFPMLWGLLAFLFNYVPTIGSIVAGIPPVAIALLMLGFGPGGIGRGWNPGYQLDHRQHPGTSHHGADPWPSSRGGLPFGGSSGARCSDRWGHYSRCR